MGIKQKINNQNLVRLWHTAKRKKGLEKVKCYIKMIGVSISIPFGGGRSYLKQIKDNGCIIQLDKERYPDPIYMYVPNFENDFVPKAIVRSCDFYECEELDQLYAENVLPKGGVYLDLGANIGNHTVYFSKICNAKRIYSFEMMKPVFESLKKNIEINHLEDIVKPYNVALGEAKGFANVHLWNENNTGATALEKSTEGELELHAIDEFDFEERIDFIKIDVEGFELNVLKGAINTLKTMKPTIYVEIFPENFSKTDEYLKSIGYSLVKEYVGFNYLYQMKEH